jgi:hypothetical protein
VKDDIYIASQFAGKIFFIKVIEKILSVFVVIPRLDMMVKIEDQFRNILNTIEKESKFNRQMSLAFKLSISFIAD